MKKLLAVLLISTSLLTVGCGGEKIEDTSIKTEIENELMQEHIDLLDSSKTYEEMSSEEKSSFFEITEKWGYQTEDFKVKYQERKEEISTSKDVALNKLIEEQNTKENIKIAAEEATKEYEVSSLDILTLNEGGYSISVQIKSDVDPSGIATELGNKLKEINEVYEVQVIDSKYQITARIDNNGIVEMN